MSQRYFIYLKYDGTAYHGWQVQPNANSVQAELQKALSVLLRSDIQVVGAGRTDTGVHARMMTAHFDTDETIDTRQLAYKLNRLLPHDISVDKVIPVSKDMHARFSATSRTYHYYIHKRKNPFLRAYSCELFFDVDIDRMNEAAALLLEYDDFAAFCKSNSDVKTTLCKVTKAQWVDDGNDSWHFVITANR
ncbi:MAG: tRNA pseudouridine synthase A, partial [Prevotella sp.]